MKKNLASFGTALSRDEAKKVVGGDGEPVGTIGGTGCSASCPAGKKAEITDCNGTCTGYDGYAECVGAHNTLTKRCA